MSSGTSETSRAACDVMGAVGEVVVSSAPAILVVGEEEVTVGSSTSVFALLTLDARETGMAPFVSGSPAESTSSAVR